MEEYKSEHNDDNSYENSLSKSSVYYNNLKMANSIKIKDFNYKKDLAVLKNFAIIITAKRNTGKSVLLKDMCSNMTQFKEVYVISQTANTQPDLFDYVDDQFIINHFDEELITQIYHKQRDKILAKVDSKKHSGKNVDKNKLDKLLFIFDDVIGDPKVKNSPILKTLFVEGRHANTSLIFLSQYFTAIPPVMRVNADISICFYLDSWDNRDAFSRQYLSTKNKNVGMMILENITKEQYQCLISLNYITDQNPENTIRKYIANPNVRKFKMCKTLGIMNLGVKSVEGSQTEIRLPPMEFD